MNLIDTDSIHIEKHTPTGDALYDEGFDAGIEHVLDAMCDAPTIDAIPVEWLSKQRELPLPQQNIYHIVYMWHKKQEAQDE